MSSRSPSLCLDFLTNPPVEKDFVHCFSSRLLCQPTSWAQVAGAFVPFCAFACCRGASIFFCVSFGSDRAGPLPSHLLSLRVLGEWEGCSHQLHGVLGLTLVPCLSTHHTQQASPGTLSPLTSLGVATPSAMEAPPSPSPSLLLLLLLLVSSPSTSSAALSPKGVNYEGSFPSLCISLSLCFVLCFGPPNQCFAVVPSNQELGFVSFIRRVLLVIASVSCIDWW